MAAREKDVACAQSEVRVEREARGKGEARPESEACTECGTRAKGEARPESEACTECGTRAKGEARAEELIEFIESCPSMFHTAATISGRLDAAGFTYLSEGAAWELARGGRYYTVRNNSSVIAWQVGADVPEAGEGGLATHFQLCASHSDSPTFKLKSVPELEGPGSYLRLDTEAYGGMIVDPEANIIFGTTVDESLGDQVRITVIATGFQDANAQPTLPTDAFRAPVASATPAPSAASKPAASATGSKDFDIPDFLKRARL